ncbi:MAG: hypothetical protein WAN93_13760 [Solirubrobacteraceae bacterium]
MSGQLTAEKRLERADRSLEDLKSGFVEAVEHLQRAPEVDNDWDLRWHELSDRLRGLRAELEPDDFDKEQVVLLLDTLLEIRELIDREGASGDLDVCDQLLVKLERIRHVVRDALDEHVGGTVGDVGLVLEDLEQWLPHVPDRVIADLVGVNRRTLSRWRHQSDTPPTRRLRVFARLIAILRHNWDEEGMIEWFQRPRRELGGRKPAALLDDPVVELLLVSAARSGRSQYAG